VLAGLDSAARHPHLNLCQIALASDRDDRVKDHTLALITVFTYLTADEGGTAHWPYICDCLPVNPGHRSAWCRHGTTAVIGAPPSPHCGALIPSTPAWREIGPAVATLKRPIVYTFYRPAPAGSRVLNYPAVYRLPWRLLRAGR
jgi:hypothetical protein